MHALRVRDGAHSVSGVERSVGPKGTADPGTSAPDPALPNLEVEIDWGSVVLTADADQRRAGQPVFRAHCRRTLSQGDEGPYGAGPMALAAGFVEMLTVIKSRPTPQKTSREDKYQGERNMNKAIRWRIISLQASLVVILAAASGFLFYEGNFVTNMVKDELTAQQVYFPGTDQIKAGGALDPAEFPQEIRDQAGNQITDGNQARIYANDFIGKHLQGVANGLTYAGVGTKVSQLSAQLASTPKDDPNYAALQRQITALGVLAALVFELFVARRKPETLKVARKIAA